MIIMGVLSLEKESNSKIWKFLQHLEIVVKYQKKKKKSVLSGPGPMIKLELILELSLILQGTRL